MADNPKTTPPAHSLQLEVTVRSLRAFRDEATFKVRPLTVFYGRNQAGKSTLLRLVVLLADSLRVGNPVIDWSRAFEGSTFKELGWLGHPPSFTPHLGIRSIAHPKQPNFAVDMVEEQGVVIANRLRLAHGDNQQLDVSIASTEFTRTKQRVTASYEGRFRGNNWKGPLRFSRLLPEGVPAQADGILKELDEGFSRLKRVRWLRAGRVRQVTEDLADFLPLLEGKQHEPIRKLASDWLRSFPGDGFDAEVVVDKDSRGERYLALRPRVRERLPLRLAGEGLQALVPLLLCACWAELGPAIGDEEAPTALAIEEPEAHLHPDLQVALLDRLVDAVRSGVPVVLETHSVYMLRAIQRAVLTRRLNPAEIGLHWVEQFDKGVSAVRAIDVRADGTLHNWLPNTFETEQDLAAEILDLRWKAMEPP